MLFVCILQVINYIVEVGKAWKEAGVRSLGAANGLLM